MMTDQFISLARQWRQNNNYVDAGGVIVIRDDQVQSWVAEFPPAKDWQPGSVVVDEQNRCSVAAGGDAVNGAARWQGLPDDFDPKDPDGQHRALGRELFEKNPERQDDLLTLNKSNL